MGGGPRVWITGAAAVAPAGVGRKAFWEALLSARSVFGEPPPSGGLRAPGPAAVLSGFSAEEFVDPRYVRRLSGLSRSSLVAARLAFLDAAYPEDPEARSETGVVLGTAFGSSGYHFEYYEGLFRRGLKEASPLLFSESVLNAASGHISQYLKLRGPSLTLVGGEDAGIGAVATALDKVRSRSARACLAGGAEEYCAIIHRSLVEAGVAAGWNPTEPPGAGPAPLGEGAALVLLEERDSAGRRGARPLAEVLGAGWGRADPEGAQGGEHVALALWEALREAAVDPGRIDLVVGGLGGGALDAPEALGLKRVLSPERPVRLLDPRRLLGEGFAFTSAAQLLVAALALHSGEIPPSPKGPLVRHPLPPAWRNPPARERIDSDHALAISTTRRGGACAVLLGRV